MSQPMDKLQERLRGLTPEQRMLLAQKLGMTGQRQPTASAPDAREPAPALDDALSPGQQRMWLFEKLNGSGSAYNIVSTLLVRGRFDADAFEWAVNRVVKRHEIFRTRFVETDGSPRQVVQDELHLVVERVDASDLLFERDQTRVMSLVAERAAADFRLDSLPLLRVAAIRLGGDQTIVVSVIHHILADGWSLRLLERELSHGYAACLAGDRTLPAPVPLQYRHFVAQQKAWLAGPACSRQIAYWTRQLDGLAPCLTLPLERPREQAPDLSATTLTFSLPRDLMGRVGALATETSTSLFMVLATAFKLTLGYLAGTDDVAVGTPVAARRDRRFEDVMGLFSNTVVLRSRLTAQAGFRASLDVVRATALDAFAHQDVPFEQVVDAVRPDRSSAHPPLFQVLFAIQATERSELMLADLTVDQVQPDRGATEFDIIFEGFFDDVANHCALTYRIGLFAESTVQQLVRGFLTLLDHGTRQPQVPVTDILATLVPAPHAATPTLCDPPGAGRFLARVCGIEPDTTILVDRGLPADIATAVTQAARDTGAATVRLEPEEVMAGGLPDRLATTGRTLLVLRPLLARAAATTIRAAGPTARLVIAGSPLEATDVAAEVGAVHVMSLPELGGPFLAQVGGNGEPAVVRVPLSVHSPVGHRLPEGVPGELVFDRPEASGGPVQIGLKGRVCPRGVQILAASGTRLWIDGQGVDSVVVERALTAHPSVQDAVVTSRRQRDGTSRLIAFAVVSQKVSEQALTAWVRGRVPPGWVPTILLPGRLPLTRDGRVDLAQLEAMPVLDDELIRDLEDYALAWADRPQPMLTLAEAPVTGAPVQVEEEQTRADAPVALAIGPGLPARDVATLPALLARTVRDHGGRGILHVRDGSGATLRQSYAELAAEASRILAGLRAAGVRAGEPVLLQLPDNPDFLAGVWTCLLGGFLPVMAGVPEGYPADHKDTEKILNAQNLLGIRYALSDAATAPALGRVWEANGRAVTTLAVEEMRLNPPTADWHDPAPDDPAILLLTSGSTGTPKAVVQTHAALIARTAGTAARYGFDHRIVSFNWMPLDHVGGVVMFHLLDTYLGAEQIHCPTPLILGDPLRWLDWIDRFRVTNTWAPNFAYALVNDRIEGRAGIAWDLSCLTFILNGGEAIVPRTARTFLNRLARFGLAPTAMKPAWGMSETCSGVTFNDRFDLAATSDEDAFVVVGSPIPGVEIRIVDEQDRPVAEGRTGRLQIRGPMVTRGYLNNAEATAGAFTADGWFVTGDLATLRAGELTICGREKDTIIINGLNYFGHEIEQVVEEVPGVLEAHVAACGVRRPADNTDRLAIFFCADEASVGGRSSREHGEAIRRTVLDRCGIVPSYLIRLKPEELPRTSIGKIERSRLAAQFNKGAFNARLDNAGAADPSLRMPAWFFRPDWVRRGRGRSAGRRDICLVFSGGAPWADQLAQALRATGRQVVQAGYGHPPAAAPTGHRLLAASDREAHAALLDDLLADGAEAIQIVHCGGLSAAPDAGLTEDMAGVAVLAAVLASRAEAGSARIELSVISAAAAAPVPGTVIGAPAAAGLAGLIRSLAQEAPALACRQIDLPAATAPDNRMLAELVAELGTDVCDDLIALYAGERFVQRLRPVPAEGVEPHPRRFQAGEGFCLLTGGLGGVGSLLAAMLLAAGADVLLIGRTPAAALDRARADQLDRLARYGARFAYETQDVLDSDGLRALCARYEASWGRPLAVAFHLAGELREVLIRDLDPAILADGLRAKAWGAAALHKALDADTNRQRPVEIIHVGSVNGTFGGAGVGAYSAANAAQEALALARAARGLPTRYLGFSMWDGIGMSRGYALKEQTAARGFALLDTGAGLGALAVACGFDAPSVLIGLDAGNPNVLRRVAGGVTPLRQLRRLEPATGTPAAGPLPVDRFGTPVEVAGTASGEMPGRDQRDFSPTEAVLAAIWRSVLQVDVDSPDANFFELGGDSIMAIQVVARANQQGLRLMSRHLFECQTIAALAAVTAQSADAAEDAVLTGEIPLGPVQHWFFDLGRANPHHFNQTVVLRPARRLDAALVAQALDHLARNHDMLRARYRRQDGIWQQEIAAEIQIPVEEVSAAGDSAVLEHGNRIQAALDIESGPLLRATLLYGQTPGEDRLILAVHHLVVDGVSWRILAEDLTASLSALLEGQPLPVLPRTSSYRSWVAHWSDKAAGGDTGAGDHWRALAGQETVLPPPDRDCPSRGDAEASVEIELDSDTTQVLLQRTPRACDADITDVLLTALCAAHRSWTGAERLYLTLEGHGRSIGDERIDLSRTVGWFTSVYPALLGTEASTPLPDQVGQIRDQRRAIPDNGASFGALRFLGDSGVRQSLAAVARPRLSFNYLGRFDVEADRLLTFATDPVGHQQDPNDTRINDVDIVGVVIEGRMRFAVNYDGGRYDAGTVSAFAEEFRRALAALADIGREDAALTLMPGCRFIGLSRSETAEAVRLLAEQGLDSRATVVMPATPTQEGLLFETLHLDGEGVYVSQIYNEIAGDLDPATLRTAWQCVVARHDAYRTLFLPAGNRHLQVVLNGAELPWEELDWRAIPETEREERFARLLTDDRRRGFALDKAPLLRVTLVRMEDRRWRMLLSEQHVVSDGWSRGIVLREVAEAYRTGGAITGTVPSFSRYLEWLGRYDRSRAASYWTGYLAGVEEAPALAVARPVQPGEGLGPSHRRYRRLSAARSAAVTAFARQNRVTPGAVVQAAWAMVLSLYAGRTDIVFGSTQSGRPADLQGVEAIVGPFITTLPLRVRLDSYATVADCIRAVGRMQLDHADQGHLALAEIHRLSGLPANKALFDTLFLVENFPLTVPEQDGSGLRIEAVHSIDETGLPLMVMLVPGDRYELIAYARANRFPPAAVDALFDRFDTVLDHMCRDATAPLPSLPWLDARELQRETAEWNDTRRTYPVDFPVHRRIERIAREHGGDIAVVCGAGSLTYAELDRQADLVAADLRRLGVGRETVVGVLMERSVGMVATLLGIWKAGAAYLPLDPVYPKARLSTMLVSSGARLVLADAASQDRIDPVAGVEVQLPAMLPAPGEALPAAPDEAALPGTLAYLMYTSGSTGVPKGIQVEQGNVSNFLDAMQEIFRLRRGDRLLAVTSICFDISVLEIFLPLVTGATVILAKADEALDPQSLQRLLRDGAITHMQATPATWQMLLDDGWTNGEGIVMLTGGDALPDGLARRMTAMGEVVNLYGPTEATVWCSAKRVLPETRRITLGRPIGNLRCYVLDAQGRPVPPGVPGELYIAGTGVARGYLDQPDVTAARFLPDPFHPGADERMYRAGDLVRRLEDGDIEFLGRIDHQVKIRGFRVEIGEVERVVGATPGVAGAVVVARGQETARHLVAYLVLEHGGDGADIVGRARAETAARLPAYMHPSAYVTLDAFPLTQNGKIDRKALPEPDLSGSETGIAPLRPATPTEREVMTLVAELLRAETLGPGSDFFALGGNSILAAQLSTRLRHHLGVSVAVVDIFEDTTIERLAKRIDTARAQRPPEPAETTDHDTFVF